MAKIIFDIETFGAKMESFDETTQDALLKYAKSDEEEQTVRDSLSLYPVTAQIVTIAMLEADSQNAFVVYQIPQGSPVKTVREKVEYVSVGNEKQLLEYFWSKMEKYDQFVTFNGRAFDCPFIMIRSAMHRLKATRNLMPDRFRSNAHIDLMEKLTFQGAVRKRFSLHMWCKAFGIKSPKDDGISGLDVKNLFEQGQYLDIARYCLGDVYATKDLFAYWEKYLSFSA